MFTYTKVEFLAAAEDGDLVKIKELIQNGVVDVNGKDEVCEKVAW